MFTGIITERGVVSALRSTATDSRIEITEPAVAGRLRVGDSVAIDGVCQTVVARGAESFAVEAMVETLRVTTLGGLDVGDAVNLETPLTAGEPLGGHWVQGHVDGVAEIVAREPAGDAFVYRFRVAPALLAQLVPKGSVALDGISLTVGPEVDEERFAVYLIPHTLEVTSLGGKRPGDSVNLEVDILAKYVRRFLDAVGSPHSFSWEELREAALRPLEGAAHD